jgi:hypothetical protein
MFKSTNTRRFFMGLGGMALAFGLVACGDDDGGGEAKGLVGSWKVAEATGPVASGNKGVTYKFSKDGKVVLGGFNKCTYVHKAPDLTITCGKVKISFKAVLKDGDKTLVLSNVAKQVMTLKRN